MVKRKPAAGHDVLPSAAPVPAVVGAVVGSEGTVPLVDWDGNDRGPTRARITVRLSPDELLAAVAARQGAVLLFDRGDPSRPVVIGLVQPTSDTPLLDAVLGAPAVTAAKDARLDGRRVVVEARDEIELRCGESSIVLRRNGRVSIRGVQLETRARGLQRIKGGKVEIN